MKVTKAKLTAGLSCWCLIIGCGAAYLSASENGASDDRSQSAFPTYIYPSPDPEELPIWKRPDPNGPWQRIWSANAKEIATLQVATHKVMSACKYLSEVEKTADILEIMMTFALPPGVGFEQYQWKGDYLSVTSANSSHTGIPLIVLAGVGRRTGARVFSSPAGQPCPMFLPIPSLRLPQDQPSSAAEKAKLDGTAHPLDAIPPP